MNIRLFSCKAICVSLFLFGCLNGCGSDKDILPEGVSITLPDNTVVNVQEGGGAPSLSNSKWQFFRTANNAQGAAFATVVFGSDGNLEAFEENTLASNIFGDEVIFDNTRRATKQAGLQYIAATYGAETNDGSGFAFESRFSAFFAGIEAGAATASATAEFDPDDPDTVRGTFNFSSRVTLIDLPDANLDDEFSFMGARLLDE
ncbi:MAG: hypothetical protein AABZ47_02375 [Planctomycetota bacterium]